MKNEKPSYQRAVIFLSVLSHVLWQLIIRNIIFSWLYAVWCVRKLESESPSPSELEWWMYIVARSTGIIGVGRHNIISMQNKISSLFPSKKSAFWLKNMSQLVNSIMHSFLTVASSACNSNSNINRGYLSQSGFYHSSDFVFLIHHHQLLKSAFHTYWCSLTYTMQSKHT